MGENHPEQIEFLTFEDVCVIHDRGLATFGEGAPGFVDEHVVRSAVGQASVGVFGKYLHAFPAGMAAAYLYFLARQQGFVQGNKRAAVGAVIEFLARNGYALKATNLEIYHCVKRLAGEDTKTGHKKTLKRLRAWIEHRLATMR